MGIMHRARDEHQFLVEQALPGIREQIKAGDRKGAVEAMLKLGIPLQLQRYYIAQTLRPTATPKQIRDMMLYAPEQAQRALQAR